MPEFKEGQTKCYRTAAAAQKAHEKAVSKGFYYSTVWQADPGRYCLHVTAGNKARNPHTVIPSKFTTAKVRRVGGRIQILLP